MPWVQANGAQIYYESYGEGDQAIVLAHGMGGNAAIWFNQVADWHQRFRIVAFDHRYFARSSCPVEQFNPAEFPADVMAVHGWLDRQPDGRQLP